MSERWTRSQKLPCFFMAHKSTVATLYAVAASKFDLTGTPYDLIIRLSAEKPARRR
jgi:energy-converting hydrogenase Eha subunit H